MLFSTAWDWLVFSLFFFGGPNLVPEINNYYYYISDSTSIPSLKDSFNRIGTHDGHIFICGDFACPGCDWKHNKLRDRAKQLSKYPDFVNLLHDHGLAQVITEPIRQVNTLDPMITNNPSTIYRTDFGMELCQLDICPTTKTDDHNAKSSFTKRPFWLHWNKVSFV